MQDSATIDYSKIIRDHLNAKFHVDEASKSITLAWT